MAEITRVEQLASLPEGTVLRTSKGYIRARPGDGSTELMALLIERTAPLTVLYRPDLPPQAELAAERDRARAARLVIAVFSVKQDAPQPFSLWRPGDKTPIAVGVQWPGGAVTIKWTPHERLATVTSASLDDALASAECPDLQVLWLAEDIDDLARLEARAEQAEARIDAVRKLHRPNEQYPATCDADTFSYPCRTVRALDPEQEQT